LSIEVLGYNVAIPMFRNANLPPDRMGHGTDPLWRDTLHRLKTKPSPETSGQKSTPESFARTGEAIKNQKSKIPNRLSQIANQIVHNSYFDF
jgi:hypothetical protein